MKYIPYILSLTISAGFVFEALPIMARPSSVIVQTCLGQYIELDLGQDNSPLPPLHKLKPCHAICCSKDSDGDGERGTT